MTPFNPVSTFSAAPALMRLISTMAHAFGWDLCIDFPAHPATGFGAGHPFGDALFRTMDEALVVEGFPFGRYCIVCEDRAVRHGTPELVDARNVLTLRHHALKLLREARNPQQQDSGSARRAARRAVTLACQTILALPAFSWLLSGGLFGVAEPVKAAQRAPGAPGGITREVNTVNKALG